MRDTLPAQGPVEPLLDFGQLFARQVARTPHATAVSYEGVSWSYAELDCQTDRIARRLRERGITPQQRIGICMDRSHAAIAAMLGILKSGGAFVPLDPTFPPNRRDFMVRDAGIKLVMCDEHYRKLFPAATHSSPLELISVHEAMTAANALNAADALTNRAKPLDISPDHLAYIMYTSGSTGMPKGVQIEHLALVAYCFADIDAYELKASDRTLQFSTLNFDIAIEEIFPPLLTGGCVVVRPSQRADAPNELSQIIESNQVTAVHIATAYWHAWVDLMRATSARVPEMIRLMVVTGEKVSTEHYRRWLELCDHQVLWCNAYGPTETTVSATVFIPPPGWTGDSMPIGKPLKRYSARILNDRLQSVRGGELGELFLGGPALARGYLNRDDLTQAAFIEWRDERGRLQRLYRSGDLARWLPDGNIEFAGRVDHQIKIGSFRIEPGEIEAVINQCDGVRESLITYDEISGRKYLLAYVAHGQHDGQHDGLQSQLAAYLASRLPAYMIPHRFVLLPSFPKTLNGKIDREALPPVGDVGQPTALVNAASMTELQRTLARQWAEVLQVSEVGLDDDFFALGGSSLLVTRVITSIQQSFNVELPVRDFFANPTLASMARQMERLLHGEPDDQLVEDTRRMSQHLRSRLPCVTPLFIASGPDRLFAVHYGPLGDGIDVRRRPPVLICHPLGHEYQRAYRNLQQLAVRLAQKGHHVLRFDYSATGNSSHACEHGDAIDWQRDIVSAAAWLRHTAGTEAVSVLGVRFGATLAANSLLGKCSHLVMWDPVVRGDAMLQAFEAFHDRMLGRFRRFVVSRRQANSGQVYGHAMPRRKRDSIAALQLSPDLPCRAGKTTIVLSAGQTVQLSRYSPAWKFIQTEDAILWDQPQYTESAFSSPAAFSAIDRLFGNHPTVHEVVC